MAHPYSSWPKSSADGVQRETVSILGRLEVRGAACAGCKDNPEGKNSKSFGTGYDLDEQWDSKVRD